MALAGGTADKVGNEYETWWTLRRIVQLLRGEIQAVTVEPFEGDGAELWVEDSGERTYDQVKFRSLGQWTPARLRSDGVLAKLRKHYASGAQVLLILSQPSEEFERFLGLARVASSGTELWSMASDSNGLDLLRDAWGADQEETRAYLLQTSVRHDGLPHLKEFVELALEMLVIGDISSTVGVLRRFLEENVNMTFTAPQVWTALQSAGLAMRPRLDPGPATSRLKEALDRHIRAIRSSVPSAGAISRQAATHIVENIVDSSSPIVLVAGKAGTGKSVVVAEAAEQLVQSGHHVTALRLDRLDPSTSTAAQLGAAIGLERSPVLTLAEVSPAGVEGILIIDQLDAVSNYSGRMPEAYEAVDEVLNQARLLGNVRVVLAVRSIDLEEDPRLRRLAGENVPTIDVGELDADEVRTYLTGIGVAPSTLDAATLRLLRLPIHLYVFSELDPMMRLAPYRTLASLYEAFTRAFRSRLERAGYSDEWAEVSGALVDRMNADEALAVPLAALDSARPLYVEALISANVLVMAEGRVSLFHETYFDYLFAKSFSPRGQALIDWFATSGQGLFRRSQLRQLLAYIASEETNAFLSQVVMIARSSLRPHLVSIAYTALEDFPATPTGWRTIRDLVEAENPFVDRLTSLLSAPKWFAAADGAGDIERLLNHPDWGEIVAGVIARLSADLPDRVLELLRPLQSKGEPWVRALQAAIEISDSPVWAEFALEQATTGGLNLPGRSFDVLETSLFQRLVESHPTDAIRLLTTTLARELDQTIAEQTTDLENVLSRRGRHSIDSSTVDALTASIGPQLVEELLPLIERIATSSSRLQGMWRLRNIRGHEDLEDQLFFAFDTALTRLTRDDSDRATPILERLSRHRVDPLDFLVVRALREALPDEAVDWLLRDLRELAGISEDLRWEIRRLIAHASRTCSDDRFEALESTLMYWVPDYENQASALALRWRGLAELELLSALAVSRLSRNARRRIAELHRKFPDWEPTEPEGISGGIVQPPISRSAAERMTNRQWLQAIEKYGEGYRRTFRDGGAFGGADELANLMGTLAKEDPSRFLSLALSLPTSTPATYIAHLIRNLAGEVDQLDLLPLLWKFRTAYPTGSGRTIVDAIDKYARMLTDDLFEFLLLLSEDVDPSQELARVESNSGFYFGGDFVAAGINSTRGQVASTLARVIFANHARVQQSLPVLLRLVDDPIVAVRSLAAEPALAYASLDRNAGLDLLAHLLDDDLVLTSSTALQALRWAMLWDSDRFAPFLTRALQAEDAKLAGAQWANCIVNDSLGSAPPDIATLSESARLGVANAISPVPALAPALLARLFDDPSLEVRRQAAHGFHYLQDMNYSARNDLIARFSDSAAFANAANDLLDALEELPGELPAITPEICRRVVDDISVSPQIAFGALTGNLVAVLVRLYRSSDKTGREAALDLIDRTVLLQLWRVEQTLDDAR